MPVYEDWWIRTDGSVKQMGGGEHAQEALRFMLNLPEDYLVNLRDMFSGADAWTPEELAEAKRRGVPKKVFASLKKHEDPRLFMLREHGWIRVAKNKINDWKFDDETLSRLQTSAYWDAQPQVTEYDTFDIEELSTHDVFPLSAKKLLNRSAEAGALKRMAMGVGRYRNPGVGFHIEDYDDIRVYFPVAGGSTGQAILRDGSVGFYVDEDYNVFFDEPGIPDWLQEEIANKYA